MLTDKRIAMLGLGKMGGMLADALLAKGVLAPDQLRGTTGHADSARAAAAQLGIEVLTDNAAAARQADVVILGVKPQTLPRVLAGVREAVGPEQLVISLAAAAQTRAIEDALAPGVPVIRAMPNLPCLVGQGMTVLCPGRHAQAEHVALAEALFGAVGRVAVLDHDELMNAVTALSGSGPAYGFIIVESLAEGGVKVGLPRSLATTLAAQALLGAAAMVLEMGEHPAKLKDLVTTPAGTTVDGLMALEEGNIRVALITAIDAATAKGRELSGG